MPLDIKDIVIVGNSSDDPFAIDLAFSMGQAEDIADLISMKTFANSEFCPRFIFRMLRTLHRPGNRICF